MLPSLLAPANRGAPAWRLCPPAERVKHSTQKIPGAPLFAGANSDGSIYYVVILLTSYANMDNFVTEAAPILRSILWKLT